MAYLYWKSCTKSFAVVIGSRFNQYLASLNAVEHLHLHRSLALIMCSI